MSPFAELECPADQAAKRLLGCVLERTVNGQVLRARIVETEAYDEDDPGSHTFRGPTMRNEIMYAQAGYLYVYFIYGMHFCCNVVTGAQGHGEAVLIRSVEPIDGVAEMERRRGKHDGVNLTNGPSKLCQALDISKDLNGHFLEFEPLVVKMNPHVPDDLIVQTTRVGLKRGAETPWRFYIRDNAYVSQK